MSDFEIFSGFDTADQMDEQSFERFKEQMKRNGQMMAADRKQEKKQKEKEEKLAKILLKFMKTHKKMSLVLLISRALEQNIPATIILSIVLLGNEDIQEEVGVMLQLDEEEIERLERKQNYQQKADFEDDFDLKADGQNSDSEFEGQVVRFDPGRTVLPLRLKIAIDLWGRNIFETASLNPHKILKNVFEQIYIKEKQIYQRGEMKEILVRLSATVLEDFMMENQVEGDFEKYAEFCQFMLEGILKKVDEQVKDQRTLEEGSTE